MSIEIREYSLVLFDRDSTLTEPASGEKFPKSVDDQQWMAGRLGRLRELQAQGKKTAIITNQGGAAWGIFEPDAVCEVLAKQCKEGRIDTFFVCFHDTSEKAKQRAKIREDTLMVGDRPEDQQSAENCGCSFEWSWIYFGEGPIIA